VLVAGNLEGFIQGIQKFAKDKNGWAKKTLSQRIEISQGVVQELKEQSDLFVQALNSEGYPKKASQDEVDFTFSQSLQHLESFDEAGDDHGSLTDNIRKISEFYRPWGTIGIHLAPGSLLYKTLFHSLISLASGNRIFVLLPYEPSWLVPVLECFQRSDLPVVFCCSSSEDLQQLMASHPSLQFLFVEGDHSIIQRMGQAQWTGAQAKPIFFDPIERAPVLIGRNVDYVGLGPILKKVLFTSHYLTEARGTRVFLPENQWDQGVAAIKNLLSEVLNIGAFLPNEKWDRFHSKTNAVDFFQEKEPGKTEIFGEKGKEFSFIVEDLTNCSVLQNEMGIGLGLTLTRYKNVTEAQRFINTTPFGKRAYVFGPNEEKAISWGRGLNFSQVYCNQAAKSLYERGFVAQGVFSQPAVTSPKSLYLRPFQL